MEGNKHKIDKDSIERKVREVEEQLKENSVGKTAKQLRASLKRYREQLLKPKILSAK